VSQTRYRIVLTLLGVALAVIIVLGVVLTPDGSDPALPDALEAYAPLDGAIVQRQTEVVIDLEPGFDVDLIVDGVAIPDSELDVVEETGEFTFRPEPGKAIEEWVPGLHAIEATWDRIAGLPEPGSLRWSFRAQ
jgi:hypothetical protein